MGAVRRAPRGPPRAPVPDRRAPRRLACRVPRDQGVLAAGDDRVGLLLAAAHARLARVSPPPRVDSPPRPDARPQARTARRPAGRPLGAGTVAGGRTRRHGSPPRSRDRCLLPGRPADPGDHPLGTEWRDPDSRGHEHRAHEREGRRRDCGSRGPAGPWRADVFYRVYRGTRPEGGDGGDLLCSTTNDFAWVCYFFGEPLATTRDRTFVVADAQPGETYRVGVGTNWANDPELGDIFAFSPPVRAPQ